MKKLRVIAAAALALTAAAACTTVYDEDRYQRADRSGFGYSEQRIDDNRYQVRYRAEFDAYRAQDFAMRRSAELTLDRRYDWFQVVNRSRAVGDDMFGRYDRYAYGDNDRTGTDRNARPGYGSGYDNDQIVILDIVMGNNPPPRGGSVYDARQVMQYRDDRRYDRS